MASFQVLSKTAPSHVDPERKLWWFAGPPARASRPSSNASTGLEPVQQGRIVVDGADITAKGTDLTALRARIGMVFQHFELYPHMTVRENLCLAQEKVLKRSRDEAVSRAELFSIALDCPNILINIPANSRAVNSNASQSPARW